jgi:hypothetical protein
LRQGLGRVACQLDQPSTPGINLAFDAEFLRGRRRGLEKEARARRLIAALGIGDVVDG